MENITLKAELLLELQSKEEWCRRIPKALPAKNRFGEQFLWVDKDGYVFEIGADFERATELQTYPCKIYRLFPVRTRTDTKD